MPDTESRDRELTWLLLYTKPHAEAWAELNLRTQGFRTLLPRVGVRSGLRPLFPRYLFIGHRPGESTKSVRNTLGVLYVVSCGEQPARVPVAVIDDIRGRMNVNGIVSLGDGPAPGSLFARPERERVRALIKFAAAGFRVKSA